jgi:hypothetical protein
MTTDASQQKAGRCATNAATLIIFALASDRVMMPLATSALVDVFPPQNFSFSIILLLLRSFAPIVRLQN